MKRRLAIALTLTMLTVLALASIAHAATTPQVTLTGTLSGNTYSMAVTVNPLAGTHTTTLHSQVRVTDASGAQVGNILPWFNEGTFKLRTVYGNRGYLQIVSSLIICFPTLPSDHINVAWVASYGAGASKVNSTPLVFKIK